MKVTTTTGWILDTDGGWAKGATEYAHKKGLKDITVVLGESPEAIKNTSYSVQMKKEMEANPFTEVNSTNRSAYISTYWRC